MIESIENIITLETTDNTTNVNSVSNTNAIVSEKVIAVTSNLNPDTYYTADTIEEKLENKLNINSYIDGGEF